MNKPIVRAISIVLVTLLVLGLFSGVFAMFVSADDVSEEILTADTTVSPSPLTVGKFKENVTIKFRFKPDNFTIKTGYTLDDFSIPASSSFGMSTKSTLKITDEGKYYQVELRNILYNGGATKALELKVDSSFFYVPLANKFFKESTSSETDEAPTSDIVVQSVTVKNASGQKLTEVNKKTEPFSIEVIFYDIGLRNESSGAIDAAKKYVFITAHAGFKLSSGTNGKLERLSSTADYPRFMVTFENIQATDEAANTLEFRVQYEFEEYEKGVTGTAAAIVQQKKVEKTDEDEEIAPLKPNIIVQEYNYGEESIVAGSEFDLNITFANTSKDVNVENVVMTIEPSNGFLIAAASNTMYFQNMNAGETKPYAVKLRALPSNTTGTTEDRTDYSLTIKFTYQYMSLKKYEDGTTSVKIAIPVEQIDRFAVDEITDYTQYTMVGNEGYVTVPIINKGKSATMNISGSVRSVSGGEFVSADVHYGNLEAGKSATIDMNLTINTPGEFRGEVVVSYEDENMNQKQLAAPFSIMVQEPSPVMPETPINPDMNPEEQTKTHPLSILFLTLGGLMVASPVALGLMKRIKSRGNEDIDEDF